MTLLPENLESLGLMLGNFGVVDLSGWSAKGIRFGEFLIDEHNEFCHAFVIVDMVKKADNTWDYVIVEAEPRGAQVSRLSDYVGCNAAFNTAQPLTLVQRARISDEAYRLVGTPYNWLDYAALALHRFDLHPRFVDRRIARQDRLMCSQLVDLAYQRAGIHLFKDKQPGDVTPGDLGYFIESLNG